MLSTGIFGDSASDDNSKTVLCARPAECPLQPLNTEIGIDVSIPSVPEDDVAFNLCIMDDFENLRKEMNYELPISKDGNHSHGAILSDADCVESLRNGFDVGHFKTVLGMHTKGSEADLLQDMNFQDISAASWQSENSPAKDGDSHVNLEGVEELIDLFIKAGETDEDLEKEEPLYSLLDVYCPIENQETSLFPPAVSFSSSTFTDCSDNICSSFIDYSEKSLTSSYAVSCDNDLPEHFSNESAALDFHFRNLLTSDNPSVVSPYTAALQQSECTIRIDNESASELRCRGRARRRRAGRSRSSRKRGKSRIRRRKTVSSESKVLSVSEVPKNSFHFAEPSEIVSEGFSLCSLSEKASEEVRLAASGKGFVSEFAKFIHSIVNNPNNGIQASEMPPDISSHSVTQTTKFQNDKVHLVERRSKGNRVRSKSKKDSQDSSLEYLSSTVNQTSSKRLIQKPSCACCMKTDSHVKKVNNSRKRESCPATHLDRVKDTKASIQHLQYRIAVDAFTTCQEQLQSLQRKLFRLLHILFPFLAGWKYIRPHSHSLELLIDEITDSLNNSTCRRKAREWQPCCPTVTLCRFPALCLRSLQEKAAVLINLLIPSLHIGDREHSQLETIIDQLISSNANALHSNQI